MQTLISSGTITAAGALGGSLDISGAAPASTFAAPLAIQVTITKLGAVSGVPSARIILEDSVDAFTNALPLAEVNIQGPITPDAPVTYGWTTKEILSVRNGVTSAVVRCRVVQLLGTTPTLTGQATLLN